MPKVCKYGASISKFEFIIHEGKKAGSKQFCLSIFLPDSCPKKKKGGEVTKLRI